jgi:hypothetical protein
MALLPKMTDPQKPYPPISEWTVATLKEHVEKMISDRDQAVRTAVVELERRLHDLNGAHAAAREKENTFYSREAHDIFALQVGKDFDALRDEMRDGVKPKWSVWIPAFALLMAIIGGAWILAVTPIQQDIKHLQDRFNDSVKATEQMLHQHEELLQRNKK